MTFDFTKEFPDFPVADMPIIPASFADRSWRNEACPCFEDSTLGLELWVDYADPDKREFPELERFLAYWTAPGAGHGIRLSDEPCLSVETWAEVEAFLADAPAKREAFLTRRLALKMAEAIRTMGAAAGEVLKLYERDEALANSAQPEAETAEVFPASIDEWCLSIAALADAWADKAEACK